MKTVKHLSVLLAVLLVVSLLVVGFTVNADDSLIVVTNEEEFNAAMVEANASATIVLANDITLTNGNTCMSGAFKGTFDGQGHTLSGLTQTLFTTIDGATVKNLVCEGTIVSDNRKAATIAYDASNNVWISDVISCVDITCNAEAPNAGGIIGYGKTLYCTNVTYAGNYVANTTNNSEVGGIAGYTRCNAGDKTSVYTNCAFTGTITVNNTTGGHLYVGALLGNGRQGTNTFVNCVNTGTITINAEGLTEVYASATAANNNAATFKMTNCVNLGTFVGVEGVDGIALGNAATTEGGYNATNAEKVGEPVTVGEIAYQQYNFGWLNPVTGKIFTITTAEDGTYMVGSGDELAVVFATMPKDAKVTLTADVTLANGMPTYTTDAFTGTFDGAGYTISGITNPMFAKISGATIQNVVCEGTIVSTDRKAATIALDEDNNAVIKDVVSYVDITTTAADLNAGGIVGYGKSITFENVIYAGNYTAEWTGAGAGVGGIIGYTNNSGTANYINCVFAGTLTVTGEQTGTLNVGAMIGIARNGTNNYENCLNLGEISIAVEGATVNVGTIAGWNRSDSATINIKNCLNLCTASEGITVADGVASGKVSSAEGLFNATHVTDEPIEFEGAFYLKLANDTETAYINIETLEITPEIPGYAPAFGKGTILPSGTDTYTIGAEDFAAFVSMRTGATEGTTDYRFVVAANAETFATYNNIDMLLTFTKGGEVVKTATKNVLADLELYASATAAGNTYVAADGSLLFGLVVTGVPAEAWDTVTVTLVDGETTICQGKAVVGDVNENGLTGEKLGGTSYGFEDHHTDLDCHAAWVIGTDNADVVSAITDGTYVAVVAIDGKNYVIEDTHNSDVWLRMDLETAGVTVVKGTTYTAILYVYDAEGTLVYYTDSYTVESGVHSTDTAQTVEIPTIGISKLTVDTTKLGSEGISHWGDGPVANLFDGDAQATKIGGGVSGTFTVTFSLTEAGTINYYTFTTGGDTAAYGRNPDSWVLYGKVGEEWVVLDTVSPDAHCGLIRANRTPFSYAVDTPTACVDYKIEFATDEGAFQMNELELFTSAYDYSNAIDIGDAIGEYFFLGIEDHHADLHNNPSIVLGIEHSTIYPDLYANNAFNTKYEWKFSVNGGELFTTPAQSCYDGGTWGYVRSELGAEFATLSKLQVSYIIVEKETNKVAYYDDLDTINYGFILDENKPDDVAAVPADQITVTAGPDIGGGEGADKVFDGSFKTKVCTGDDGAANAIVATLSGTKILRGVGLCNANDNEGSTGRTVLAFEIYVSADGENWGDPVYVSTGEGKDKKDYSTNFMEIYYGFEAPVEANYVKVVVNNGELYQLSEIFLYTNNTSLEAALTTVDSQVPVAYDRDITADGYEIGLTVKAEGGHFNATSIAQLTAEGAYAFVKEGDEYVRYDVATLRTDRHCDIFFVLDGFTPVADVNYEIHFFFIGSESCSHPGGRLYLTGNEWVLK